MYVDGQSEVHNGVVDRHSIDGSCVATMGFETVPGLLDSLRSFSRYSIKSVSDKYAAVEAFLHRVHQTNNVTGGDACAVWYIYKSELYPVTGQAADDGFRSPARSR